MKQVVIFGLLIIIPFLGISQFVTKGSGSYLDADTWEGGNIPPNDGSINNETVLIKEGNIVYLGAHLSFKNGLKLTVNGELTVGNNVEGGDGDLEGNGIELTIGCQGKLTIYGNIVVKNVGKIIVDGILIVDSILGFNPNSGNCIWSTDSLCPRLIINSAGEMPNIKGFYYGWEDHTNKCDGGEVELPIDFLSFTPIIEPDRVLLNWTTGTEINNDYFTIERSRDMYGWEVLGFVDGAGNSSVPLSYSFSYMRPLDGLAYYRLKQTDFDGQFKYYGPIAAHYDLGLEGLDFKVMKQYTNWVIAVPNDGLYQVEVYNLQGHRLHSERVENTLTIPAPQGAVVIRVTDGFERSASRVVM